MSNLRWLLRGGSSYHSRDFCRAAFRFSYFPDSRFVDFGFRLVGVEDGQSS